MKLFCFDWSGFAGVAHAISGSGPFMRVFGGGHDSCHEGVRDMFSILSPE
jgi:hypothetical protein